MKAKERISQVPPPTPDEELAYVRQLLGELRAKASKHDRMLAYLLEIAYIQCVDLIAGREAPNVNAEIPNLAKVV